MTVEVATTIATLDETLPLATDPKSEGDDHIRLIKAVLKDKVVSGPATSTDNAIVRFDGTTGKIIQDSTGWTIDDSGNLTATGTARRITGDFSNATVASRTMFQTSTADSPTNINAIPNGTSGTAAFGVFGASDPTNASLGNFQVVGGTEVRVVSNKTGSGTYLPLSFYASVGGAAPSMCAQINTTDGAFKSHAGGIGYGVGAGGTVTQITSKSTGVTLNKPSGQITMHNAALAANTSVAFTVTNSFFAVNDLVALQLSGGAASGLSYSMWCQSLGAGSFSIVLRNITGGSLSESVQISFAIIKGSTT